MRLTITGPLKSATYFGIRTFAGLSFSLAAVAAAAFLERAAFCFGVPASPPLLENERCQLLAFVVIASTMTALEKKVKINVD